MIATEQGGRGASMHRGRSAFLDAQVRRSMQRLLELGGVDSESRSCSVAATRLHYLTAGAGPPLLLIHGAGGGAANWYLLMRALARHFSLIAVDLPGFGLSDSIEPVAPLGHQVAGLLAEFLNRIHIEPAFLVGTSFGGLVALRVAQRVQVRKLILIDPAGLWRDASWALRLACLPGAQRLGVKQTRRGARWLLRHVLTASKLDREHEIALAEYLYATAARTDARMLGRAYSCFGGLRGQAEVLTHDELTRIAAFTLVLWGEQDRFLPASDAGRATILAAGAELRIIPGVGHSPNWEAPTVVLNEIFRFAGIETGGIQE